MRPWKWLLLIVITLAGVAGVLLYSHYERLYPSTENAYLDATAVRISSEIEGPVTEVYVRSQHNVTRGAPLFAIDETPYLSLEHAAAAELALAHRQVAENSAELASAEADVQDARVHLSNARDQLKRLAELKKQSYSSEQQTEDAEAAYERARAALKMAEARLAKARARVSREEHSKEDILVTAAKARLTNARWALGQTQVRAPCDGILESVDVHVGETVRARTPVMVLICTDRFWVNANFKETQINRIAPGQSVEIEVDMYPDKIFQGVVESLNPATGTAFSLLPPENATGNWVKTTQRVPVKIRVTTPEPAYPLRVGASSKVTIDTRRPEERS